MAKTEKVSNRKKSGKRKKLKRLGRDGEELPRPGALRHELMRTLALTYEGLSAETAPLLRSHGLSESGYELLHVLSQDDASDGIPTLELASRMTRRGPDITRLSTRLEAMGLLGRARAPEDRRVVLVSITEGGRAVVEALEKPLRSLRKTLLGHLSAKELLRLNRLLATVGATAARDG